MWGVRSAHMRRHEVTEELINDAARRVVELGWCKPGQRVGITAGLPSGRPGIDLAVPDPAALSPVLSRRSRAAPGARRRPRPPASAAFAQSAQAPTSSSSSRASRREPAVVRSTPPSGPCARSAEPRILTRQRSSSLPNGLGVDTKAIAPPPRAMRRTQLNAAGQMPPISNVCTPGAEIVADAP